MKKGLICLLCLILVTVYAGSALAATTYTLPEKMDKQLAIGSGLKGSFLLTAEGNDPLVLSLNPLLNIPFQMRGMKSGQDWHYYLYQATETEEQKGLTECYFQENTLYFRSDLLPGRVFSVPALSELLDRLTAKESGNPSFASMLIRIANLSADEKTGVWNPFIEKLAQKIELWIEDFKVGGTVRDMGEESSILEENFTIPMNELRKEILVLLDGIRADGNLRSMLESLMTDDQKAVYLNDYLNYFYLEAMEALQDDFDVTLSRTVSMMGEEISSSLELPLDRARYGYDSLTIDNEAGTMIFRLKNDQQSLIFVTDQDLTAGEFDGLTFWVMSCPDEEATEQERKALRVDIQKTTETYSDEETRDHQKDHWSLRIETDLSRLPEDEREKAYETIAPITAEVTLHYFSKYSQSSPTTLEISARFEKENLRIGLEGQWKTASPWVFSPFDISGAEDFLEIKDEEKVLCLAEWLAAASEQFTVPAEEPEAPEETASAAEPAADEAPAEEPQATSAEEPETSAEENPSETESAEKENDAEANEEGAAQ